MFRRKVLNVCNDHCSYILMTDVKSIFILLSNLYLPDIVEKTAQLTIEITESGRSKLLVMKVT